MSRPRGGWREWKLTYDAGQRFTRTHTDDLPPVLAGVSRCAYRPAHSRATPSGYPPLRGGSTRRSRRNAGLALTLGCPSHRLCFSLGRPSRLRAEPAGDLRASGLVAHQRLPNALPVSRRLDRELRREG